ncbi:unannotated protein [freshwater metagenome]|uniref:Unannotated protein n=1 Tax=freshwater metagenome TaxID=449393 RepID=A0A6J6YIF6_9ZZZZ
MSSRRIAAFHISCWLNRRSVGAGSPGPASSISTAPNMNTPVSMGLLLDDGYWISRIVRAGAGLSSGKALEGWMNALFHSAGTRHGH